jgi:FkbM family methyltransferase
LKNNFLYKTLRNFVKYDFSAYLNKKQKCEILKGCLKIGCGNAAAEFYRNNYNRIKRIASILSDKRSKQIYLKIIKYRYTHKVLDFPGFNEGCYFRNSFFTYGNSEVLIDCGAFTGDTIQEFLSTNIIYEKIIAFEPELENFKTLESNYGNNPKFMLMNAGVYSKDSTLYFSGSGTGGMVYQTSQGIDDEVSIKVRSIDGLRLQEKVTFIKMDIEGAEMDALLGAKETILRDKPKLAICIYHSNEDMVRIAEYINQLIPEYKLYVRHNSRYPYPIETVLYATI